MTTRAQSELLLVGSLPADSTEEAFQAGAELFADLVFALPDGETGPRRAWVGYERERLVRPHPDVETLQETESPTGIPRHAYETPVFKVRAGVAELHWESWPRIDDAITSYETFRELKHQGVIPSHLRFQIGLPFPSSALNGFKADFAADYAIAGPAFEDLVRRELERLTSEIPASELAIQWDVCYEVLDIEGVVAWMGDGAWERFTGPVTRLTRLIPEDVLVGYHLCYGTFPEWPMYEARDMGILVPHGELRRRGVRAHRRLAPPGRTEVPAERGRELLPAAVGSRAGRRARLPRNRAAGRRGGRPRAATSNRVEIPRRLRRGDVLRVRPATRRGADGDDARAPPRGRIASRLIAIRRRSPPGGSPRMRGVRRGPMRDRHHAERDFVHVLRAGRVEENGARLNRDRLASACLVANSLATKSEPFGHRARFGDGCATRSSGSAAADRRGSAKSTPRRDSPGRLYLEHRKDCLRTNAQRGRHTRWHRSTRSSCTR